MAIVVHPLKVKLDALERAVAEAEAAANAALGGEHGWEPTLWFETTSDEAGQALARTAVEQGATVVAAAGGDGTVRAVAEALRGTETPLALLPHGTGNLLAVNLGIPVGALASVESAVQLAFGGVDRRIDLGVATVRRADGSQEEHTFTIIAGIGLDAAMIQNTRPELKRRIGWVAYIDGIARAFPSAKPFRVNYRLEGRPTRSVVAHSVVAANCGSIRGGITMLPQASLDDGLLDIAAIRPRSGWGWVRIWNTFVIENGVLRRTSWGRRVTDWRSRSTRDVAVSQAPSVEISLAAPAPFEIDGEDLGDIVAARVRVDAGAILVRVAAP